MFSKLTCSIFDFNQFCYKSWFSHASSVHSSDSEAVQPTFFQTGNHKFGSSDFSVLYLQRSNKLGNYSFSLTSDSISEIYFLWPHHFNQKR